MFSLIKYHNAALSVVLSNKVEKVERKNCIVKCNGGKYSASLISSNDDKSILLDIKSKREEKCANSTFPTNSTQLKLHVKKKTRNKYSKKTSFSIAKSLSSYDLKSTKQLPQFKNTPSTQTFLGNPLLTSSNLSPPKFQSAYKKDIFDMKPEPVLSKNSTILFSQKPIITQPILSTSSLSPPKLQSPYKNKENFDMEPEQVLNNKNPTNSFTKKLIVTEPIHATENNNKSNVSLNQSLLSSKLENINNKISRFKESLTSLETSHTETEHVINKKNYTISFSKKSIVTSPLQTTTSKSPTKLQSPSKSLMFLSKSDGNCLVSYENLITINQIHTTENITEKHISNTDYPLEVLPDKFEQSNYKNSPNKTTESLILSSNGDSNCTAPFFENLIESIVAEEVTSSLEPGADLLNDNFVNTIFNVSQQSDSNDISLNYIYDNTKENALSPDTTPNDLCNTRHNSTSLLNTEMFFERDNCTDISSIQVQGSSVTKQIHTRENIMKEHISYMYPLEILPDKSEHLNNKNSPHKTTENLILLSNIDSDSTKPFFDKLSVVEMTLGSGVDHLNDNIIVNTTFNVSDQSDISLNYICDNTDENVLSSYATPNDLCNTKHNSTSLLSNEMRFEKDNCTDISSIQVQGSSVSEYFPNSTAEISTDIGKKSLFTSLPVNETSIDVVENPLNIIPLIVPYRSNKSKQHFCIFCKTLQCKLPRHFFLKHKNEKQIKMAFGLPKNSKERLSILDKLRKKGDFLHNTSEDLNSGILIVSRQQQKKSKNEVDDYACCKTCKGFFSKQTLCIHIKKCGCKKNERSNLIEGRRLTQYIHSEANELLKTKIFPVLRNDEVSKSIRYDELVIKFGNKLSEKYSKAFQHDMIRAKLRLLGRFKIEMQKLDPEITELKQIFKPYYFDKCIKALRTVSNWDNTQMLFKAPAVVQSLSSLIKKCCRKQRAEFIKTNSEDLKRELENFLILWEEEVPTLIHKKALEDQSNQKRIKKVVLPSKDDIKKLYTYLRNKMFSSMAILSNSFSNLAWSQLVQATLIFIQIFNRRRAGEIERLTIDNYSNKENITDSVEKDVLENVTAESMEFAKQFVRITLRGKLGRTVSVLLSPICINAVDVILKFRTIAGIPKENEFIFSKPSTSKMSKQYHRACPLLRKFSEECGAQIPESLRGTTLRKHIATYTSLLNIEEASVERLANFMGHHKDIHKNIYRMTIPVAEITCVSKILMSAIGVENEDDDDDDELIADDDIIENEIEDIRLFEENAKKDTGDQNIEDNESDDEDWLEVSKNPNSSSYRKRRSTSPFGKTKRCRWTTEERDAIYSMFGDIKDLDKLPSLTQCQSAALKYSVLKKRTPQQIKTWIDNQRRYK